ncbi:MAG: DUF1553 domain-containing protein [Planctomycetales bacterium]|nr:DUF1553 domain-containing protein [Planctomycetales bacterium]
MHALAVLFTMVLTQPGQLDFDRDVAPVLAARCAECHSGGDPRGGLSLLTRQDLLRGGESGSAIDVAKPLQSELWQRVSQNEMPPRQPLDAAEKAVLKRWLESGAPWGDGPIDPLAHSTAHRAGRDWWSLQPLKVAAPPELHDSWGRNAIDAFIYQRLRASGLAPSPPADPRVLVRRLYFDLIGLPPPPEVVDRFVSDPSDEAYLAVVNELLASPRYGERWARHWLDVVRFGESNGFERNQPRANAWPYRDWVIDSLNRDLPYRDFVRAQLIGDLETDDRAGAAATGFWVAGVHNTTVGGSERMKKLARQDEIEEVLATVGQSFLGITFNCARCHDHKFDPMTQREYYQLASAISGLQHGERTVKSHEHQETLAALDVQLRSVDRELREIDRRVMSALRERQGERQTETAAPRPDAAWLFDGDLRDSIGELHGVAAGQVRFDQGAVVIEDGAYVVTSRLPMDVREKTLSVVAELADVTQQGGGAITLETSNGVVFDSIVFGEREPGRWMAGSNNFLRSDSFGGSEEKAPTGRVQLTVVYRADGEILAYRNGQPYGRAIRKAPLQPFAKGDSEFVFGLRHKPAGGNRHLRAKLHHAAFFARALSANDVAAFHEDPGVQISEQKLLAFLHASEPQVAMRRTSLKEQRQTLAKQISELQGLAEQKIYTLTPGPGEVAHLLVRGDPDKVGDELTPGGMASIPGGSADFGIAANAPEAERRRLLADWITHRENALFLRVAVNRVWHYHFGAGIVDTPNDFGFNGGQPTHPELLDWLADRFARDGQRFKSLHRLIVLSETYRQASFQEHQTRAKELAADADNRLLWRMSPRRLEAEAYRDALLAATGKLNSRRGGPSFEDVAIVFNSGTTYYEPKPLNDPEVYRRTIYRFNPRGGRSALLDTLDCPDSAATAPKRAVTTTPLQALALLNSTFVVQMSNELADRICAEAGDGRDARIQAAWRHTLQRAPSESELSVSRKLYDEHGLRAVCRGLFNISEFLILE